ncbi:hypothetical protein F9288_02355 [Sphingomonas sp. CL5.1]|nr:hypothetical protein [Sphingomonas sp. CL5.1]QKR98611.1 hypothetical protein F9288_02355 [Sphingomonas sp. CL5.1]
MLHAERDGFEITVTNVAATLARIWRVLVVRCVGFGTWLVGRLAFLA